MSTITAPRKLLPAQKRFMQSDARYVLYSGAFASGKTLIGCNKAIVKSISQPNNFGLIGCRTYPMLRDTVMRTFFEELELWEEQLEQKLVKEWQKTAKQLTLINGSEIIFRAFERAADAHKYKSLNLGWFYIDEATTVDYDIFRMLQGRLRLARAEDHQGWLTTNPAGFGNWVYKRFYDEDERLTNCEVVEANTFENVYLDDDYVQDLKQNYRHDQDYYNRYLEGKWGDMGDDYEFTQPLIDACVDSDVRLLDPQIERDGVWLFGVDIGRRRDMTAIVGFRLEQGVWVLRYIKTFDNTPFKVQREHCKMLLSTLNVRRMNIDETGIGMEMAEELQNFARGTVKPISFTAQNKEAMVRNVKRLMNNTMQDYDGQKVRLPKHQDLIASIRAVKRKYTESSTLKYEFARSQKLGHLDLFAAMMLALYQSKTRPARFKLG